MAIEPTLIRPKDLPAATVVNENDAIPVDNGLEVARATPVQIANAGAPVASEAEAIAGVNNTKRMTPLLVKQVVTSESNPWALRARAWAESPTPPNPDDPNSKSAKTWAGLAATSAGQAQAFRDQAEAFRDEAGAHANDAEQSAIEAAASASELTRATFIERVSFLTVAGVQRYEVDSDGDPLAVTPENHILFGMSPFGPLTYGVDYTVSGGGINLAYPPAAGELYQVVKMPRVSNSEAQVILDGLAEAVAGAGMVYADRDAAISAIPSLPDTVLKVSWVSPVGILSVMREAGASTFAAIPGWTYADLARPEHHGAVGDEIADDTAPLIELAASGVAYAVGDGRYLTTASIPGLHVISWTGKGLVKRGAAEWRFENIAGLWNILYVALAGDDGNDGLSAAQPFSTLQAAYNAVLRYGPMWRGRWRIVIGDGVRNDHAIIYGFWSAEGRLEVTGRNTGGAPAVIFDGTGSPALSGIECNKAFVLVQDVEFKNWRGGGGVGTGDGSKGLYAAPGSNVWSRRVYYTNCSTGFYASMARAYQGGGIVTGCDDGTIAFASSQFSSGYGSRTVYSGNVNGIVYRDASSGVIDDCELANNTNGVVVQYGSVARVSNSDFSGSVQWDIRLYTGGSVFRVNNTHTPGKMLRGDFAIDLNNANKFIYFAETDRFNFGALRAPAYPFHFNANVAPTVAPGASFGIDANNASIALNSAVADTFSGLMIAKPSVNGEARITYHFGDPGWRMWISGAGAYRWSAASFRPEATGTQSLGAASFQWAAVHTVLVDYGSSVRDLAGNGSPEGVVTAGTGSTYRRRDGGAGTSFYVKETGAGNTGWVAK